MMKNRNMTDPLELIQMGLDLYQAETYGKRLLNCGDIISICEALGRNRDILLKNRGSYAEVVEMQKNRTGEDLAFFGRPGVYRRPEEPLRDWQREIMEEDQARSGYLYGKVI